MPRHHSPNGAGRRLSRWTRPTLERLEERCTPATVTNLNDTGVGSLRDAIANTPAGGLVDFQAGLTGVITLGSEIDIDKNLDIGGPGADKLTISGKGVTRIFTIDDGDPNASIVVSLENLTLTRGKAAVPTGAPPGTTATGGAINAGNETLLLNNVVVSSSTATTSGGGVQVADGGTLQILNSTITNNTAADGGGVDVGSKATVTVLNSTLSKNKATNTGFGGGGGMYLSQDATLNMSNSVVSGNTSTQHGGGLYFFLSDVPNALLLTSSQITGNAAAGKGGGVYFFGSGDVTIDFVTASSNTAAGNGGAFYMAFSSKFTLSNSLITGNNATGDGAGVDAFYVGSGTIENTTIVSNSAAGNGGGVASANSSLNLNSVTVVGNAADSNSDGTGAGGGVFGASLVTITNSIVAGNTQKGVPSDVQGSITAFYSLIQNLNGAVIGGGNDITGKQPMLGKLQDNGGPTPTMALLPGSPAIDFGDPNYVPGPTTDQRGGGFHRVIGANIDMGAYEYQPPATRVNLASSGNPSAPGGAVTFTATVTGQAPGSNFGVGSVEFDLDGNLVGVQTLINGSTNFTTTFPGAGTHTVTAKYQGFTLGDYTLDRSSAELTQQVVAPPPPPPPPNTPPQISDVTDRSVQTGTSTGLLPFTVSDAETAADNLVVTATSSNPALLPASAIVLSGSGGNRAITVTPATGQTGSVTITLTVTDAGNLSATDTFVLTITAPPVPPPPPPPLVPPLPPPPPPAHVGLFAIGAGPGGGPEVRVLNPNGTIRYSFFALEPNFTGGVVVATGDINGDGVDDIVTAAGPGGGSHVKVFDGATAAQIGNFFAFDPSFTGGVSLALGDVNGDGHADLIIGAGPGGAPHVRVFDGALLPSTSPGVPPTELASFFAYDRRFRGGVNVAAGDIDGDGVDEIITGAGAEGGPHVQVFDGRTLAIRQSFFAYEPTFSGGVTVAAGDLDGDGRAEIITGTGAGGGPLVNVFRAADATPLNSFFAYDPSFLGGVTVAFDVQSDGTPVLLTGPGVGGGPVINGYTGVGANVLYDFFAFDPAFRGGAYVG